MDRHCSVWDLVSLITSFLITVMLSWIKKKLGYLKPRKNHSPDGSTVRQESGREEEVKWKDWLVLSGVPPSPPTPRSPSTRYFSRTIVASQQTSWSVYLSPDALTTDQPEISPQSQLPLQWKRPCPPSNTQTKSSPGTLPTSSTPDKQGLLEASQDRQPSSSEARISSDTQQGIVAAADGHVVVKNDQQVEGNEVLGPTKPQNSYPCCFLPAALTNHIGELVTVKGKRYVRVTVKKELLMVSLESGPSGEAPCRVLWRSGKPVPLVELPDLTNVKIDASVSPGSERFHAVVVWQENKPDKCLQLLDDTYIFLDSRGITCQRNSLDIVTKKLSIVFDGTWVSAEICDAVVFLETTKITMVELLQFGCDQFYATVFKMLQGTGSGRILYVCTCLWVGKRPTLDMLPMVIEKEKLCYKVSHGLYATSRVTQTLYCDVDASLSLLGDTATLEVKVNGSSRFLVATHLISLQHANLKKYAVAPVIAHIGKEICGRKEEWSVLMIRFPGSTSAKAAPPWLAARQLALEANKGDTTQGKSVSFAKNASVPSKEKASISPALGTSILTEQKAVDSDGRKHAIPTKQTGTVPAGQMTSFPTTQKDSISTGQNVGVPATKDASIPAGQTVYVPATQKASIPAGQKAGVPATQIDSIPAGQANVPSTQKASILVGQKASVPPTQKASLPARQKTTASGQMVGVPPAQVSNIPSPQKPGIPGPQKSNIPAAQYVSASVESYGNVVSKQKTTAPTRKTQQKSASLSQLLPPSKAEPEDVSSSSLKIEYLTCRVLTSGVYSAVVTAAGKKILVVKGDLFINEALLSSSVSVASSLKKFPNVGVLFTRSKQQHVVLGHVVEYVALIAWAGKKPSIANTIANRRMSKMREAAAPKVTPAPLATTTTVDATCYIGTVHRRTVTLTVRSKYLPEGCGTTNAKLCDMYQDGKPMTQTSAKKLISEMWHCRLRIENGGKQLTVPIAWRGKKPVTDASVNSSGTRPRQALSTGDLRDSLPPLLSPPASKPLGQKEKLMAASPSPVKVLVGEVTEVLLEGGRLRAEDGRHFVFPIESCFLFDVSLQQVEARQVLVVGMKVEFEVVRSSSGETVGRVWVGGRDVALAFTSLEPTLDSWCSRNGVPLATQETLMKEAELLSPSLFPTASKVEATKTIDITA